ncbi:gp53-like domain-containing protein [Citrobacter freundii]
MAINNFKPFALDPNANVTSQADWEALPALLSGFTAGKASSAQVNKAIRQASFIAAALAQYTANKSGLDVLDDGDLNGFISKMGTAFGKDFQALDATLSALAGLATGANKLPYFTGNDTAAQTDLTSVGRDIIGKNTITDILTYLGLSKVMIGDWGYKMGFIADIKSQPYINHQASGDNIVLATLEFVTNALHGKQPLDETLTAMAGLQGTANKIPYFSGADTLDLTDLSAFARTLLDDIDASTMRATLGLKAAALREIGTGTNQIPDMSVQGFGSNWVKTVGGLIIQKGSVLIPQGQNYATVAFPIPFLSGGVVNLTWSDTPSNTGTSSNITYGVVAGSNLPTGFQAWMAGAGGYNLSYIAIGY